MTAELSPMLPVPAAEFLMGSDRFYPDEAPQHRRPVEPFELDQRPVTNADFARFVADTGYVTVAERPLDPALYPGLPAADLAPGSLVFRATAGPVPLHDWRQWWAWVPGASWRHPHGPGSSIAEAADHPVVQVCFADAEAFAAWAGKRLPSEAELELAAGAGTTSAYAWGDERDPDGRVMANTWRGAFPHRNDGALGWRGTSPVGTFPANEAGFVDLIGNVWEWTTTYYLPSHAEAARPAPASTCCAPARTDLAAASAEPGSTVPRRVLKGGSHLCAPEYCLRYRPAARSPQAEDSATTHLGFRCAR